MKKLMTIVLVIMLNLVTVENSFAWNNDYNVVKYYKYETASPLEYSPDWKSNCFIVSNKDYSTFIVKDWIEYKKYYKCPVYSPNGKESVSFLKWNYWEFYTLKNWKKINATDVYYSPDWKSFSYTSYDKVKWVSLIKDWIKWKKYDMIWDFSYTQDSKNIFYTANIWWYWPNDWWDWKYYVVKNWVEISEVDDYPSNLTFTKDWKNYAFITFLKWKSILIKDWKEVNIEKYDDVSNLKFSPNWDFLFVATKWDESFLVKNWIEDDLKYNSASIGGFTYSPDWKSLTYMVYNYLTKKSFIVKDWKIIFSVEKWYVWWFSYSPDGKSTNFVLEMMDWKNLIYKDWKIFKAYELDSSWKLKLTSSLANSLKFSPDWKWFSYILTNTWNSVNKHYLVVYTKK